MIRTVDFTPILNTLDAIQKKHGKGYCYPTQDTILRLLRKYHHLEISIRTLNRWLRKMEDQGYIQRKRRVRLLSDGYLQFASTLYTLTRKAYKFVGRLIGKLSHHKRKVSNWVIQKERPSISAEIPGPEADQFLGREENLQRLGALLAKIG